MIELYIFRCNDKILGFQTPFVYGNLQSIILKPLALLLFPFFRPSSKYHPWYQFHHVVRH